MALSCSFLDEIAVAHVFHRKNFGRALAPVLLHLTVAPHARLAFGSAGCNVLLPKVDIDRQRQHSKQR